VAMIRFLEKLTIDYNMHICCIIHENPQTEKATGWLGSQILKKAEIILKVVKDPISKRISHVSCDMTRGEDFDDFSFEINGNGIPEILLDFEIPSNII